MAATAGDLIWIEVPEAKESVYLPAQVKETKGDVVVAVTAEGRTVEVSGSNTFLRFVLEDNNTRADVTALVHMNEPSILDNLFVRHKQNKIYTLTASVLLAMNPYKEITGLYGEEQCQRYKGVHIGGLPPHPYAIADAAYRTLVRDQRPQALLISGESGAGKTETAKIVMEFLAYTSGAASDLAAKIQARVLQAQPILESFGNAATLRNSNSSRFGKYNRVFFDAEGTLVDAGVTTYLLEASRVVAHGERERTYHVFYELLAGVGDEQLSRLRLEPSRMYQLMHAHGQVQGFESKDSGNFDRLCEALRVVGLDNDFINSMLEVLAGLIHLGNLPKNREGAMEKGDEDEAEGDAAQEVDDESVQNAGALLGMDPDELAGTLTHRTIKIKGRSSLHKVTRTAAQFRQALHSFIKALYKRLFESLVDNINTSFNELSGGASNTQAYQHIGILDIYGFERLQRNSFEQLCINLANERLQQFFIVNVLAAEQKLYEREGLPWSELALPDSTPVVNCVYQVFKTLDDFSSRQAKGLPTGGDEKCCEKITEEAAKDQASKELLKKPRAPNAASRRSSATPARNQGFCIRHYAGDVEYNILGWMDKNNDRLLVECEELIQDSSHTLVKSLGEDDTRVTFRSISKKYTSDLEELLDTLASCNLHYIRCFKPNAQQKPDSFDKQLVLDQIVQCGTLELVKIMHDGFPNRCDFEALTTRFRSLLPDKFRNLNMRTFVEVLMQAYDVPTEEWKLGMSRLFLKAGQLQSLEAMRTEGRTPDPSNLERIVKSIIRKRWVKAIHAVKFCNWLPKLLQQIYVQRATRQLRIIVAATGGLAPRLQEARLQLAERKLCARRKLTGAMHAVRMACASWRTMRANRQERLASALYRATLLTMHMRPLVVRARACLAEASVRHDAERKREEQRFRLEMERKLEEERRCLEEQRRIEEAERHEEEHRRQAQRASEEAARRAEEEALLEQRLREEQRLQEERRILNEERQRLEEERGREDAARSSDLMRRLEELERHRESADRQREEDRAKAEKEAEEAKMRLEEERLAFEAERKRFEDQRQQELKQFEAERKQIAEHRKSILQSLPTPARSRLADEAGAAVALPDAESAVVSTVADSCDEPCDDIGPMDSISHAALGRGGVQEMESLVHKEMERMHIQDKLANLEQTFASKHDEILDQMRLLQEKNELLEKQVELGRQGTGSELEVVFTPTRGVTPQALASSSNAREPSLLTLDGPSPPVERQSPPATPPEASQTVAARAEPVSSTRRYSLLTLDGHDARSSTGGKLRHGRNPVREDAVLQDAQRRLWAEQRQFLLEDLYGEHGGPCVGSGRGTSRRLSTAGLREVPRNLDTTFEEARSNESRLRQPQVFGGPRSK